MNEGRGHDGKQRRPTATGPGEEKEEEDDANTDGKN